jgi:hypothetical protein
MVQMADGGGSGWPAPDVSKELKVHRDELKKIAKRLQDDLDSYSSDTNGTIDDLQNRGNVNIQQLGNYTAAQGLQQSVMNANQKIGQTYQKFSQAYLGVINAINQSAGNYDDAEQASESGVNAAQPDTSGGAQPTTSSGGGSW